MGYHYQYLVQIHEESGFPFSYPAATVVIGRSRSCFVSIVHVTHTTRPRATELSADRTNMVLCFPPRVAWGTHFLASWMHVAAWSAQLHDTTCIQNQYEQWIDKNQYEQWIWTLNAFNIPGDKRDTYHFSSFPSCLGPPNVHLIGPTFPRIF